MNKDVIYVEPEDDITDIILKIENAKEKIVALVPPKKAGVFRSVVNIKLIAKSGATSKKKIVLVTTDPSIIKLAASAKIPVTKNLQSAPSIPEVEADEDTTSKGELIEESDGTIETEEDVEELKGGAKSEDDESDNDNADEDDDEEDDADKKSSGNEAESKDKSSKKMPSNTDNKFMTWIGDHKKLVIAGGVGALLVIVFLFWAFVIAPAVTVTVGISTTLNKFSENVNFTTTQSEEKTDEGLFFLDEKKIESIQEVEFEATGEKNVGEKATGKVIVYAYFPLNIKASTQISEGETFTISGLVYSATKSVTLSYNGEGRAQCANKDNPMGLVEYGCRINGTIPVVAAEPGSKYNIAASSTGWNTNARVFAYSEEAMDGGTDDTITIVLQSDIDKAKESLVSTNEKENKEKLMSSINQDALIIESSFAQTTAEAISTPGVGEEVKKDEKPKLKAVTTASIFTIDKTKVEEYIREKANVADGHKIYEITKPFIDTFAKSDSGYLGKLKASYLTGPELSVSSIVELIKGKGLGDAQTTLKDINGVTEVKMNASFPWVMSIPSDTNKITVNLDIKDQSGNKIEQSEGNQDKTADVESDKNEEQEKKE